MTTFEMDDLDTYVQTCLIDRGVPVASRAQSAVEMIESIVRAEFSLSPEVPLHIPPEWQHKLPVEHRVVSHVDPDTKPLIFDVISHDYNEPIDRLSSTYTKKRRWRR